MARREASRSQQAQRSQPVVRRHAFPGGKRGTSPQQSSPDGEGWSVVPDQQDGGSDTEWLIVGDEEEDPDV
jgi:hypothetical protein